MNSLRLVIIIFLKSLMATFILIFKQHPLIKRTVSLMAKSPVLGYCINDTILHYSCLYTMYGMGGMGGYGGGYSSYGGGYGGLGGYGSSYGSGYGSTYGGSYGSTYGNRYGTFKKI